VGLCGKRVRAGSLDKNCLTFSRCEVAIGRRERIVRRALANPIREKTFFYQFRFSGCDFTVRAQKLYSNARVQRAKSFGAERMSRSDCGLARFFELYEPFDDNYWNMCSLPIASHLSSCRYQSWQRFRFSREALFFRFSRWSTRTHRPSVGRHTIDSYPAAQCVGAQFTSSRSLRKLLKVFII
jgi:hypothetical protein